MRRLKEASGFAPLPSAKEFNHLAPDEKRAILTASFAEMRRLGIHYDFAPVIDVDYNPDNPNIGRIKRSFSADIAEVEANALLVSEVARAQRIGLCLKHFPGIGGAVVDSHQEFMDISDSLRAEQEELFYSLAPKMFGDAVLVSHAIVRQWDRDNPMTLSAAGLGRLRKRLPDTLLITDDMQMQGLQKALGTREASLRSLRGRHGHALHRQQPVRPGAGNGRHRRLGRTEPARRDLVGFGHRAIDRAGGQAKGAVDDLTGGTPWIVPVKSAERSVALRGR